MARRAHAWGGVGVGGRGGQWTWNMGHGAWVMGMGHGHGHPSGGASERASTLSRHASKQPSNQATKQSKPKARAQHKSECAFGVCACCFAPGQLHGSHWPGACTGLPRSQPEGDATAPVPAPNALIILRPRNDSWNWLRAARRAALFLCSKDALILAANCLARLWLHRPLSACVCLCTRTHHPAV